MVTMAGTPRAAETVFQIGEHRYLVVEDVGEIVRQLPTGVRRSWEAEPIPLQGAEDEREFELPLRDFSGGSGFSFADAVGVYETAHGWACDAPGVVRTLARLTTGEETVDQDSRGFLVFHEGCLYMLRGRYATKYIVEETATEWPVVERFDFGALDTNAVVAGPPVKFGGDVYVPLWNSSTHATHEWVRLSTVATHVQETQTLTVSGDPSSGTWTATFNGTTSGTIAIDATAATVQTTLRAIPGLQDVTVERSGTSPNWVYTVAMVNVGGDVGNGSPPEMTAGDTFDQGMVTPATSVAGTSDTWTRGPANEEAACFATWQHPLSGPVLVRADGNIVSFTSADPLTEGNWGTEYEVGDDGVAIASLFVYDRDLCAWKQDGTLWTFDPQAFALAVPDVNGAGEESEGIGVRTWFSHAFIPTLLGLWRWRPGAARKVGPEQDGALDGGRSSGWGKVMGLVPHGDRLYYAAQDNRNLKGIVGSFTPEPRSGRNPLTPHTLWLLDEAVEDVEVMRLSAQPPYESTFAGTATSDDSVGTVAWDDPDDGRIANNTTTSLLPTTDGNPGGSFIGTGTAISFSTSIFRSGSKSLQVTTASNAAGEGFRSGAFTVMPSTTYRGSVYVYGEGTITLSARKTTGGAPVIATTAAVTLSASWQRIDIEFTTDSSTTSVYLFAVTDVAQSITFYLDDWEVMDGAVASTDGTAGTTEYLKVPLGSALTLPTSSTIKGIEVQMRCRKVDASATAASIVDSAVKLVQAGTITGDSNADTATEWPTSFGWRTYGGPTDLWGLSWNAASFTSTFGVAVSADITEGIAEIDGFRFLIYYEVAGAADSAQMLAVLTVDGTRTTAQPFIYQLPRNGLTAANDPLMLHIDAGEMPEYEVWASVDDGPEFQLYEDAEATTPAVATIQTSGFHRVFFPADARSVGRWCQLILKAGTRELRTSRYANPGREIQKTFRAVEQYVEINQGVTVRDLVLRGSYRPDQALQHTIVVKLQQGTRFADGGHEARSVLEQRRDIEALNGRESAPVPFRLGDGTTGYCEVTYSKAVEVNFTKDGPPTWVGVIRFREAPYGDE